MSRHPQRPLDLKLGLDSCCFSADREDTSLHYTARHNSWPLPLVAMIENGIMLKIYIHKSVCPKVIQQELVAV